VSLLADFLIVGIEVVAALFFLIAFDHSIKVYQKTKKVTDIWLLISFSVMLAFFGATFNALQWVSVDLPASQTLDAIGEHLSIIFSLVWIYIAYRFLALGATAEKKDTSQ